MRSRTVILWGALALSAACTPKTESAPSAEAQTVKDELARGEKGPPPTAKQPEASPKKEAHPGLRDPSKANETAPERYTVKLETTKGDMLIDVTRAWSPTGADRFYNLVRVGYYDDVAFFRVIAGFMAQVGISGDPSLNAIWREARIKDDPVVKGNQRGYVTFAKTGAPNSRTTQFFINFKDNSMLDRMGFASFGVLRDEASLKVLDSLHSGYGEGAPRGRGPSQGRIQREGNAYLKADFPKLDYIKRATILSP